MDCLTIGRTIKARSSLNRLAHKPGDKLSVSETQRCYARVTLPTE